MAGRPRGVRLEVAVIWSRLYWLLLLARRELWKVHRRDRGRAFVLVTLFSKLFDAVVIASSLAAIVAMVAIGAVTLAVVIGLLTAWLLVPHLVVEHVAIRFGLPRVAHAVAQLDPRGDRDRWPLLCAARAIARDGASDGACLWLARRHEGGLDATMIAAWGIVAHGRGDRDDARRLLRSLGDLGDPAPEARGLAGEWLALDAAERGAWQEILDDARALAWPGRGGHRTPRAIDRVRGYAHEPARNGWLPSAHTDRDDDDADEPSAAATADLTGAEPLWPATPVAFLLEGVAGRLLGRADAPSQIGLWLRWMLSSHRRATLRLVRAALAPPARTRPAPPAVSTTVATAAAPVTSVPAAPPTMTAVAYDPHANAIAEHARALAEERPTAAAAAATVAAWGAVVDAPGWTAAQLARAVALGVPPELATATVTAARDQLVASLVELAIAARTTAVDAGGSVLASTVATRARARILDGMELSFERAHDRIKAKEGLPPLDEWRAFLALRASYEQAASAGGVGLERVAYPHAEDALGAWAVSLWNDRHEYVLSHAISAWLYERALVVGDAAAIELHGRNASLELPG